MIIANQNLHITVSSNTEPVREGWLRGHGVQKLEDNEGRKKGRSREERREYRERTSAGRVLAWRRSEPSVRLPSSSSSRKARLVYLCPSLHEYIRIIVCMNGQRRQTRRNGNNQVVCVPEAVRARARARPSLLASLRTRSLFQENRTRGVLACAC